MQDKNITKFAFSQFFRPIFSENLQKELIVYGVDKYVKKLTALQIIQVIICAQLKQNHNLREISNNFDDGFSKEIGIDFCLYDHYELFLKKLSRQRRSSKGRRKIDYERIYEMTERQVKQCEAELLYEIAYDPVIL